MSYMEKDEKLWTNIWKRFVGNIHFYTHHFINNSKHGNYLVNMDTHRLSQASNVAMSY